MGSRAITTPHHLTTVQLTRVAGGGRFYAVSNLNFTHHSPRCRVARSPPCLTNAIIRHSPKEVYLHKDTNIYILHSKEFTKLCVAVQSHPKTEILYHCAAAEPVGDTQWPGARASSPAQLPSARSTLSQGAKGAFRLISETVHLDGQRQGNRRLGRRLARAPEAVAGRPEGRPLPGSAELPRAARRALRRHRSRAGALSKGHFAHAAARRTRMR